MINLSILNSVVIDDDGPCCVFASLSDVDLRVNHITRTFDCFLCECVDLFCEILIIASKCQSLLVSFLLGWRSSQSSTHSSFLYREKK